MSARGDLGDLSVGDLVSGICAGRRTTGVAISNGVEEGFLYFAEGQVVHAEVGGLDGEPAIQYLLNWKMGTFRISDQLRPGVKALSGSGKSLVSPEKVGPKVPPKGPARTSEEGRPADASLDEEEDALEVSLLGLLSHLEQVTAKMDDRRSKTAAMFVIGLEDLVNLAFASQAGFPGWASGHVDLPAALHRANEEFREAPLLEAVRGRLSIKPLVEGYERHASAAVRVQALRGLADTLVWVLSEYFAAHGRSFQTGARERRWNETYAVFLDELRRIRLDYSI